MEFLVCLCARPLPETNRTLSVNEVYLIDSGAQYKYAQTSSHTYTRQVEMFKLKCH